MRFVFFILLLVTTTGASAQLYQPFQWCYDGYQPGGGTYSNVNNSGIDIEISGLNSENCSQINFNDHGEVIVSTGLNNLQSDSVQHRYVFKFSETISISFRILDINYGDGLWNDLLVFSGNPVFFNQHGVTTSNDTVYPGEGSLSSDGVVSVYYEAVDSIVILHGIGEGVNPGYILIGELYLNAYPPELPSTDCFQGNHYLYQEGQDVFLNKVYSQIIDIRLINELGQEVPVMYTHQNELLQLHVATIPKGVYFVLVQLECGQFLKEKVLLN